MKNIVIKFKKDRTKEILEKSERINAADREKFAWVAEDISKIVFNLESSKDTDKHKSVGDEVDCFLCGTKKPRGICIIPKGKLPNWQELANGEMREFSFRQYLCSEKCKKEFEDMFYKFVKEGKFVSYKFRKAIWKILNYAEWWNASFHEAEVSFKTKDQGYICKGCRKQKSLLVPYFNVIAKNNDSKAKSYWRDRECLAGRVCSKECYDLFLMKVI